MRSPLPRRAAANVPAPKREGTLARRIALEVILESDGGKRAFIDELLDRHPACAGLPERDRHLLQEIAFGAVRHRNTLDHLLDGFVRFAMKRQRPSVRWALRLAAYQLVYLNRIPAHAAISRTLEALKGFPDVARREIGFANAVLRRLDGDILEKSDRPLLDANDPTALPAREGFCRFKRPVLPIYNLDPAGHLSLKHSHPRWMVERWIERFPADEIVGLLEANSRVPPVTAHLTARAPGRAEVVASLAAQGVDADFGLAGALVLKRTGDPRKLDALRQGWIRIQDSTAAAIGEALAPPEGARILDLCAAPGVKSLQIVERIGASGRLLACDADPERLARLRENLERAGGAAGAIEARLVPSDPAAIDLGETFTHVLVDAPCSNSGVLARRPEARWRIRPEDLARLAERQRALLAAGVRHLEPGGTLVYSTCSIEPEENERVVEWAVERLSGLQKVSERLFLPHRDGGDGGYCAVLQARVP